MKDFSVESRALRMQRFEIEDKEGWHGWCDQIPAIPMKQDWEVRILPPFMGAMARFSVRRGVASVSVYLDVFDRLGSFSYGDEPVPHWEIYPDAAGDNWRCPMEDVDALVDAIEDSLERQERDRKPGQPSVPVKPAAITPVLTGGVSFFRLKGQDKWTRCDGLSDLSYTIDDPNSEGWSVAEDDDGWTTIIGDADHVASELGKYIARVKASARKEDI